MVDAENSRFPTATLYLVLVYLVMPLVSSLTACLASSPSESNSFGVYVGLHQDSALNQYLFLLLMYFLIEDVRKDVPESIMFADDIVLCADDETYMTE